MYTTCAGKSLGSHKSQYLRPRQLFGTFGSGNHPDHSEHTKPIEPAVPLGPYCVVHDVLVLPTLLCIVQLVRGHVYRVAVDHYFAAVDTFQFARLCSVQCKFTVRSRKLWPRQCQS